jgi:hypothetical protein
MNQQTYGIKAPNYLAALISFISMVSSFILLTGIQYKKVLDVSGKEIELKQYY